MLKTLNVEKLVKYALYTGFLNREISGIEAPPVSLMLIAPPESNKTSILKQFESLPYIKYTTDLSGKPLAEFLKNASVDKYHHLIVPDFIKIVGHKQHIVSGVITTLNAMIEEGVRTSMFYGQELDLKKNVQCGLITSITPDLYKRQFRSWYEIGFLTRFIPVSYTYSEQTRLAIMKMITGNDEIPLGDILSKFKKSGNKNICIGENVLAMLRLYTEELVKKLNSYQITSWVGDTPYKIKMDIQGFRLAKQLILLTKAIAFERNLDEADAVCLEELKELLQYMCMPDNPMAL